MSKKFHPSEFWLNWIELNKIYYRYLSRKASKIHTSSES